MLDTLGSLTFNITNVCNLNCQDCAALNNYAVAGHQRWQDNESHCRTWAKHIDPVQIFVLGGEPMTNPDFIAWIRGLADIWPHSEIRVTTNGTLFDRWPTLYDDTVSYQGRINFSISSHNEHNKSKEIATIQKFLRGKIHHHGPKHMLRVWAWNKIYHDIKDPSWPKVVSLDQYHDLPAHIRDEIENVHSVNITDYVTPGEPVADYSVWTDENHMRVGWARWDQFEDAAIKFDPEKGVMTLHDSDPEIAVSICHGGHCAQIKHGKLYKCEFMSIIPDMLAQGFPIDISQQEYDLIHSYTPAEATWSQSQLEHFVHGLQTQQAIPQCRFCPEQPNPKQIWAGPKKPKVNKVFPIRWVQ